MQYLRLTSFIYHNIYIILQIVEVAKKEMRTWLIMDM